MSFADVEYDGQPRQTRRERFLQRMDALLPWARLEARIRPVYPTGARGRPPYPLALLLRIHCVQLFYNLSDPAMEDALYDSVAVQRFVGLTARDLRPDETTILHFRHLLERHHLGEGLLVEMHPAPGDAGPTTARRHDRGRDHPRAPASTKNRAQARDPEMGEEGQPVVLRDEGAIGVDAARGWCTAWRRRRPTWRISRKCRSSCTPRRRVGRCGVCRRGSAPGAPGPGDRLAGGVATRAAAALAAGQWPPRRSIAAGQGGASVPVEAPLRLHPGAVSQEPHPAVPFGFANLLLAERAAPR